MCVYVDLLQRAMYEVGDLWAAGRISVAVEHMASAQTVDIMRMGFPLVPSAPRNKRKVIISCTAGENHVMGSHMVADLMELQGWDVISLGADTPLDSLVLLAEQMRPDLLGLSVTMPSNLPALYETIHTLRQRCGNLPIMVGGQALSLANQAELPSVTALRRVQSVSELAEL
jgi:methanogenic corrinoid protein MtbC1